MRHAVKLILERRWYGYPSMVFKYNSLARNEVQTRVGPALEVRIVKLPVQTFAHQSRQSSDHDQREVFFRSRKSGCERDLASTRRGQIETEGTVHLSSLRFAVRGLMFSSLRGLSSVAVSS